MKNEHWIIYRKVQDPLGIRIIAVCHTEESAERALKHAARLEARRANARRKEQFENGEGCNPETHSTCFTGEYYIEHVTEIIT